MTDPAAPTLAPRDWSAEPADVLLADGSIAVIRSLREDDRDAVLALHESVSVDTLRLRFFSPSREAGRAYVDHLFSEDNTRSAALVALVRDRVAGLATAELLSPDSAEVAFLVADELLVLDIQHGNRQDTLPMRHDPLIGSVVAAEILEIVGEGDRPQEIQEIA